jgi:hypothetical protein
MSLEALGSSAVISTSSGRDRVLLPMVQGIAPPPSVCVGPWATVVRHGEGTRFLRRQDVKVIEGSRSLRKGE